MKCTACRREDVLYPVIDKLSNSISCPYCGALKSLEPGIGESEDVVSERLDFARSQGWRFMMTTTFRVIEQEKNHLTGYVGILYTENEGERFQSMFITPDELETTLNHFRNEGKLRLPHYGPEPYYRDIPIASLLVVEPGGYMCKVHDIAQVDDLPKTDGEQLNASEEREPMV